MFSPTVLHVRAAHDLARRRREAARQQVEERRLARAVAAQNADALAAQDSRCEIVDDFPVGFPRIGEREVLHLEDAHAAGRSGVEPQRRRADGGTPRGKFGAQFLERGHAPLVARRARLDAPADPCLLLGELLGLARPVDGLVGLELGLALDEGRVVARPARELAAVEVEDRRRHALQEAAVVRHDQDGHLALAAQEALQPVDGRHVEVVRRLVEEQQVGARQQRLFEDLATAAAARQRIERRIARAVVRDVLRNVDRAQVRRAHDRAAVGLQFARDDLQERGLAFAVAPGQRRAQPLGNRQRDLVQHRRAAERQRDVLKRKKKITHSRA